MKAKRITAIAISALMLISAVSIDAIAKESKDVLNEYGNRVRFKKTEVFFLNPLPATLKRRETTFTIF